MERVIPLEKIVEWNPYNAVSDDFQYMDTLTKNNLYEALNQHLQHKLDLTEKQVTERFRKA